MNKTVRNINQEKKIIEEFKAQQSKAIAEVMLRRKGLVMLAALPTPTMDMGKAKNNDELFAWLPESAKNIALAATVAKNMESLGYTPDKALVEKMIEDNTVTAQVAEFVIPELVKLKGADVHYAPMYPNFPRQVMDMSDAELYVNAIIHYATYGVWSPEYEKEDRPALDEKVKLTKISLGSQDDCKALMSNMLNSVVPFAEQDKEDIGVLSQVYSIKSAMPSFMPNRENLATLACMMIDRNGPAAVKDFAKQVNTVTDVLRIMNARHGNGDITLASKFDGLKKITRAERRAYLGLIDNCKNAAEDMKINKSQWIKVGEALHPGEYQKTYRRAFNAFNSMRDKVLLKDVHTFNAVTENAMLGTDAAALEKAMTEKPGVFARNLDRLLRNSEDPQRIADLWEKLSPAVAPNLLWQVHSHFDRKIREIDEEDKKRVFTIMGENPKVKVVDDTTKPISVEICQQIKDLTEKSLKDIYKDKPAMGKVYIDPQIAKCKVPNNTRDASKGTVPMAKGSRLPLGNNANVVRGFIWWTNLNDHSRLDVDLSAAMLNKNLELIDHVAYYGLRNEYAVHSGDFVDGGPFDGKGTAEFIDIDLAKAQEQGVKYVAFSVNSFTQQLYRDMEHIRFGFMEREKEKSGEVFEPSTVQQVIKLNAPSTVALTCMFDVETKEMIWVDAVAANNFPSHHPMINNLHTTFNQSQMHCHKAIHLEKPDIDDVIRVNVEARGGEIVSSKEEAEVIFALSEGIKPTDLDYFAGNLLPAEVAPEFLPEPPVIEAAENEKPEISTEDIQQE